MCVCVSIFLAHVHLPGVLQGEDGKRLPPGKVYGPWAAEWFYIWEAGKDAERRKGAPKVLFLFTYPPHDYLCTGACLLEVPPIKFTFLDIKKTGMNEDMDILACLLDSLEKKQRQTSLSIRFKSFDFSFFSGTSSEKKDSNKANLIIHITIWMILPDMIILIYLDNLDILFQHFFRGCVCVCGCVFTFAFFFSPDPAAYQCRICTWVATVICYQSSNRERDEGPNLIKPELPF